MDYAPVESFDMFIQSCDIDLGQPYWQAVAWLLAAQRERKPVLEYRTPRSFFYC